MRKRAMVFLLVTCLLAVSAVPAFADEGAAFGDIQNHWARDDIQYIGEKGIISGIEKGSQLIFMPDESITRAQMIKMLVLSKGIEIVEYASSSFSDVPRNHWALSYIEAAKTAGITEGYNDGTFKPERTVTREEMAVFIVRAYDLQIDEHQVEGLDIAFEDMDAGHWAYDSIEIAIAHRLLQGFEMDGKRFFNPSQAATRGQVAVVLARHLKNEEVLLAAQEEEQQEEPKPKKKRRRRSGSSGGGTIVLDGTDPNGAMQEIARGIQEQFDANSGLDGTVMPSGLVLAGFTGDAGDVSFTAIEYGVNEGSQQSGAVTRAVPGLVGSVFEFETNGERFSRATLTFDVSKVTSTSDIGKLTAVYLNESNHTLEFLPTTADEQGRSVTFTTTHNSKYVLVDADKWEEAWRKELTVAEGVYQGEYIDFAFVIDSSGSMSSNDPQNLRKKAVADMARAFNAESGTYKDEQVAVYQEVYDASRGNYIGQYQTVTNTVYAKSDRAAVIDFDLTSELLCSFSADPTTVADAVYYIDSEGGTDIFAGVREATAAYETYAGQNDHRKIMVLLTDGQNNDPPQTLHWNIIEDAAEQAITIITMGLGDGVDSSLLQKIAQITGGQYYKIETAVQIENQLEYIQEHTKFGQDSDGDGIKDIDEIRGLRLKNGMIVYTDPAKADTDGDGVNDGEELGDAIDVTITLPSGATEVFRAYDHNSFPDDPNSK